jgi:hypothetical protein
MQTFMHQLSPKHCLMNARRAFLLTAWVVMELMVLRMTLT